MRPTIPSLTPLRLSTFGRRDAQYTPIELTVQIDNQDTLSGATYDQMLQLCNATLPITKDDYIRMWKTLILKRVQDVYEKEKHIRAADFVRLDRSIYVPATLNDLLYSLGSYFSNSIGFPIHILTPAKEATPKSWWTVDNAIVSQWSQTCHRMNKLFLHREFPPPSVHDASPMSLTCIHDATGDLRSVASYTNEPAPQDSYVRFVNDDIFKAHARISFGNCGYLTVQPAYRTSVLGEYVGGYVLDTNA